MGSRRVPVMTVLVAAALVTAAALLFTQTSSHRHHQARSTVSSPTTTSVAAVAPPVQATGTIVYGRMVGGGQFTDAVDGVHRTPPDGRPERVVIGRVCCLGASPATGRVSYSATQDGRAETYDVKTSQSTFTTRAHRIKLVPSALSSNANWVAFEGWDINQSYNGMFIQAAAGGKLRQITTTPTLQRDRPLAFSPDDSRLLFFRRDRLDQNGGLYVIKVDGTGMMRLSPPGAVVDCCFFGSPASWSPNGRRVAFSAYPTVPQPPYLTPSATYVIDRDGSHRHRITDPTVNSTSSRWSPDGRWIVYDTPNHPNHHHDLFLVHPDGTGGRTIDTNAADGGSCCAQWSPNSKSLVFEHGPADDNINLYIVNIDGSGPPRQITSGHGGYFSFAWLR